MNITPMPPQDYLQECFEYCENGTLLWKKRPLHHFLTKKGQSVFNKQTAGKLVGCVKENNYASVTLNYEGKRLSLKLHRIIWCMFNGPIPDGYYIDHWDTDKKNNKKDNLRPALPLQNSANSLIHTNSTSKVKGVSYAKRDKRWLAHITVNYKQRVIGRFLTQEEATACIVANREKFHLTFSNNG